MLPRAAILASSLLAFSTRPSAASAETLWLDNPLEQWNKSGQVVPAPEHAANEPGVDPRCLSYARPAETGMDSEVVASGWTLFNPYQAGWGITVITGLSGYDGMCRPWSYHQFVFVDGHFAGTLAPVSSASRSDGALFAQQTDLGADGRLTATFVRYADSDPLCCPSRPLVRVTYHVDRSPSGPVLIADRKDEVPR